MNLPAYGRDLLNLQRAGRNVAWLCVSLDWNLGRALPRLVVPKDADAADMNFEMTRDLSCWIVHDDDLSRALAVADAVSRDGGLVDLVTDYATGDHLGRAEIAAIRGAA